MSIYLSKFQKSFKEELNIAMAAIRRASAIAAKDFFEISQLLASQKSTAHFVRITSKKIEKEITRYLQKYKSQHGIYSEGQGEINKGYTLYKWFIDPLNGVTNFMHGIPFFSISIALLEYNKVTINTLLGVVHNPITNETFFARKGYGAKIGHQLMQSKKITVSSTKKTGEMICITNISNHTSDIEIIKYLEYMTTYTNSNIRMFGSLALELAYLADSRIHLGVYKNIRISYCVASMLIVQESGNIIVNLKNQNINFACMTTGLLVSKKRIIDDIIAYVSTS